MEYVEDLGQLRFYNEASSTSQSGDYFSTLVFIPYSERHHALVGIGAFDETGC